MVVSTASVRPVPYIVENWWFLSFLVNFYYEQVEGFSIYLDFPSVRCGPCGYLSAMLSDMGFISNKLCFVFPKKKNLQATMKCEWVHGFKVRHSGRTRNTMMRMAMEII